MNFSHVGVIASVTLDLIAAWHHARSAESGIELMMKCPLSASGVGYQSNAKTFRENP
jgi:hypothetical protein